MRVKGRASKWAESINGEDLENEAVVGTVREATSPHANTPGIGPYFSWTS